VVNRSGRQRLRLTSEIGCYGRGLHHHYLLEPVAAWVLAEYSGCAVRPGGNDQVTRLVLEQTESEAFYELQRW